MYQVHQVHRVHRVRYDGRMFRVLPALVALLAVAVTAQAPLDRTARQWVDSTMKKLSLEQLVGPIAENAVENAVFACDVKGDSMSPGIQDGDVLIVRRWIPTFDPASRRPGVAIIEDEGLYVIADPKDDFESACVKRLVLKEKERRLVVLSDNKRHKAFTLDLTSHDFEEAKFRRWQDLVLGVPVKLIRDL